MHSKDSRHLILFLKYPEPGQAKTRLAKAIGKERAAELYRELAEATVESLRPLATQDIQITLAFEPADKAEAVRRWLPGPFEYEPQKGRDLGERLTEAAESCFSKGASQVILLGSDTVELKSTEVLQAFEALESHDAVLGPAWDGGYYLVGMNSFEPLLFQGISWSSPFVLQETVAKLKQLQWSHFLLPLKRDIDLLEDLEFFTTPRRNP